MAHDGESILVPRVHNKNVVIISEEEYNHLNQLRRMGAYLKVFDNISSTDNIRNDNLNKLDTIQKLQKGWNGSNDPAFPVSLIDKIRDIVIELEIQPEIFPTALGTIQLEYENSRKDHMELEISDSSTAEVFTVSYNGTKSYESIQADAKSINMRVQEFYK